MADQNRSIGAIPTYLDVVNNIPKTIIEILSCLLANFVAKTLNDVSKRVINEMQNINKVFDLAVNRIVDSKNTTSKNIVMTLPGMFFDESMKEEVDQVKEEIVNEDNMRLKNFDLKKELEIEDNLE